jgi:hypothetical protein
MVRITLPLVGLVTSGSTAVMVGAILSIFRTLIPVEISPPATLWNVTVPDQLLVKVLVKVFPLAVQPSNVAPTSWSSVTVTVTLPIVRDAGLYTREETEGTEIEFLAQRTEKAFARLLLYWG